MRVTLIRKTLMPSAEDGNLGLVEYIQNESGDHILVHTANSTCRTLIKLADLTTV